MTPMNNEIKRYRELAGIVESRPAYMGTLGEETETQEVLEARISKLTETELQAEINDLISERELLTTQLKAAGLFEHYLERQQYHSPDAATASKTALGKSTRAKSHTIHKKLLGLKQSRVPSASWVHKQQSHPQSGALQRNDTHEKPVSDYGREDRKRRQHAQAAFHHFDAAQQHRTLGNIKKAERHATAAEAHHLRAKDPEDHKSGYMYDPKTGRHTEYTAIYDKKGEKARKNKISKAARIAKKKAAAAENPDTRAATAAKELKVWKAKEAA